MNGTIRVAICDDHRVVTEALRELVNGMPGISCVGTASSAPDALFMLEHIGTDVLLTDLDMPGMDGFELVPRVHDRHPDVRIVVLTMHDEPALVERASEVGADGYVLKSADKDELALAIREVFAGRRYFGGSIASTLLQRTTLSTVGSTLLKDLSTREVEVLAALAEGIGNKEIGARLFISPRTVDTHRTNLMRKLKTHNLAGLVRIAIKAGLVR
ncbi:MAG: response regulator transcription factor [Flavobacteriales bacterium]|jgi:two-component system response regulator NreC|nr:response regulator transcription factor [Flavobacteriales bacterium]